MKFVKIVKSEEIVDRKKLDTKINTIIGIIKYMPTWLDEVPEDKLDEVYKNLDAMSKNIVSSLKNIETIIMNGK